MHRVLWLISRTNWEKGKIIAAGGSLRGDNLAQTYKDAVEKKAAAKQIN